MRLLLTSSGISNPSISGVLVDLLGKPIAELELTALPSIDKEVCRGRTPPEGWPKIPAGQHQWRVDGRPLAQWDLTGKPVA